MRILLATLALSIAAPVWAASAVDTFRSHLGLQLYSLRDQFSENALAALDRLEGWQIKEVETAGTAGMTVAEFRKALVQRGLKAVSAHVQYGDMEKDIANVVGDVKALGVSYAFCPWIPHQGAFDVAAAQTAAANFNRWGAAFNAVGIKFGYHPHGYEFGLTGKPGGERVFDVLAKATDPELVGFELDIFWVYHSQIDPTALLKKLGKRVWALHVKDLRKGAVRGQTFGSAPPTDQVAVGQGEIDWKSVLSAASDVGVLYYFIEDETTAPLRSIPDSLAYLRALDF